MGAYVGKMQGLGEEGYDMTRGSKVGAGRRVV